MTDHQIRDRSRLNKNITKELSLGGPEFVCSNCGSRCTESPTSDVEYGHRGWCEHSAGLISQQDANSRAERKKNVERVVESD